MPIQRYAVLEIQKTVFLSGIYRTIYPWFLFALIRTICVKYCPFPTSVFHTALQAVQRHASKFSLLVSSFTVNIFEPRQLAFIVPAIPTVGVSEMSSLYHFTTEAKQSWKSISTVYVEDAL